MIALMAQYMWFFQVSETVRNKVLKGCKIVIPTNFRADQKKHNCRLWKMAMRLGASCAAEYDQSVTHVVSRDFGTRGSRWAVEENKFLVHPDWLEAAYFTWKKQPEENFPVTQLDKCLHHLIQDVSTLCVFREVKKLFTQNYGFAEKMKEN